MMYSIQGVALLAGLVALQTAWGVAYEQAVRNADAAIEDYVRRHGNQPVELAEVEQLLRAVAPRQA